MIFKENTNPVENMWDLTGPVSPYQLVWFNGQEPQLQVLQNIKWQTNSYRKENPYEDSRENIVVPSSKAN